MHQTVLQSPVFRKLSDNQLQKIHAASLEILERTGVSLHDDEAIALLKQAGITASDDGCFRIPASRVEWALELAPKQITLYDRNGNPAMSLEGYNVFYGTGSDCPNVIDLHTGEFRPAILQDIIDGVRVSNALSNIDSTITSHYLW